MLADVVTAVERPDISLAFEEHVVFCPGRDFGISAADERVRAGVDVGMLVCPISAAVGLREGEVWFVDPAGVDAPVAVVLCRLLGLAVANAAVRAEIFVRVCVGACSCVGTFARHFHAIPCF